MFVKVKIKRLIEKRNEKEIKLTNDRTDWGEIKDMKLINKRLSDINECKNIDEIICELQVSNFFFNYLCMNLSI